MKKLLYFIIVGFFFLINSPISLAHPLDITHSDIYVEDNNQIITGQSFIHPFLIGLLLETNNIKIQGTNDFYNYAEIIGNYLNEKIKISNNDFLCVMTDMNIPPLDEFEIMGSGLEIDWSIKCHKKIEIFKITNTLFIEYSNLQTNKINIFHNNEKQILQQGDKTISEIILTYKVFSTKFDFQNKENNKIAFNDKDNDGLSDEEEILYATNPELADTDNDGYNDKEEIENGWDPLFAEISPGQIIIEKTEDKDSHEELNITSEIKKHDEETGHDHLNSGFLTVFLEKIKILFDANDFISTLYIFLLIFILGTLHAIQPGHGKSILISYLIEHNKKPKDAIKFISSMTITHLADVIILGIAFKFLSKTENFYHIITYLKDAAAYILLSIGLYYLYKVIINKKKKTSNQCCSRHNNAPKAGLLGFIAGLAPCAIGWSIMLLLFSLNKENWIIPSIIIFGLGIWTSLFILSLIIIKSKKLFYKKLNKFTQYSSLISAILLIIVAIFLIFS